MGKKHPRHSHGSHGGAFRNKLRGDYLATYLPETSRSPYRSPLDSFCSRKPTWKTAGSLVIGFFIFYLVIFLFVTSSVNPRGIGSDRSSPGKPEFKSFPVRKIDVHVDPASLEGPCGKFKKKLDLLIVVLSDSYDEAGRNLIRATYGGLQKVSDFYTMTFFLIDVSNGVQDEQALLREMKVYGDSSVYVSEFSLAGSESLNFNISNFPKTDTWVKSCVQNSNFLLYFEHLQEIKFLDMINTLKISPNYLIPSALPNSNIFITLSSSVAETIGAKIEDWGVFIPNNLERIITQIPERSRNLQWLVSPKADSPANLTETVPEYFRNWLTYGSYELVESNDIVFKKLRIEEKYSRPRLKTATPVGCSSTVKTRQAKRVLILVDSQIKSFAQREAIRATYGSLNVVERNGATLEIFIRFLASQYKYLLFKDEDTRRLDLESKTYHDVLGYFKMTIHDIPSFNSTSSIRLALEWALGSCSIADYIMLISDETFVNPYLLHDYITYRMDPDQVYIDGLIRHTSLPVRKYNREGFVSKVLYPDMIFPPYPEFANGALMNQKTLQIITSLPYKIRDPGINEVTLGVYAKCASIPLRSNPYHNPMKESYKPFPLNSISVPNCSLNFSSFWLEVSGLKLSKLEVKRQLETNTELLKGFNKTDEVTGLVPDTPREFPVEKPPNKHVCPQTNSDKIELLFLIISAPGHINLRSAIRNTWGKIRYYQGVHISRVFLLGLPSSDLSVSTRNDLSAESDLYGDVVLLQMIDSYRNATYKTVNGLHWALKNCAGVDYIHKIDDDAMANIFGLTYYISHFAPKSKLYMGQISKQGKVMRKFEKGMPDKFKKWIINKNEYPADTYPPYALGGPGYVLSRDVAKDFVEEAWKTQVFVFEDAYIGILNTKVKINPVSHYLFNNNAVDNTRCDCHKFYASHYLSAAQMCTNWFHLHSDLVKCQIRRCNF